MNAPSTRPSAPPPESPPDRPAAAAGGRAPRWRRVGRGLLVAALVVYFLAGGLLLGLRAVVVPHIADFRPEIAAAIGRAVGLPVTIEAVSADWSGLSPRLHLAGFVLRDAAGRPALDLGTVDATLSWSSLVHGMPRFRRIELNGPGLALRRERDGTLYVAGVAVGGDSGPGGFSDWLLQQGEVVVRGATVTWNDARRAAPELRLDGVDFRLVRRGGRHLFGLRARPPAALATALDVRGELGGLASGGRQNWRGTLYVAVDRADLGGWRAWIDYPIELAGSGGVRAWIDVRGGAPVGATADLVLDGVRTRLAADLPALDLTRLAGRLDAERSAEALAVRTRGLSLLTADGVRLAPTDFELALERGGDKAGRLHANALDFDALRRLAAYLPVDPSVRERLAAFDPSGHVSDLRLDWQGPVAAPQHWSVHARVANLGVKAKDALPGVGGLAGEIDGDEKSGRFRLAGEAAWLDLPAVFPESRLAFSALRADGGWARRDGRVEIALDRAEFANPDASGSASGRYRIIPGGRGEIDLSARLVHAEGAAVWRYMPLVVNPDTRSWLRRSIVGGVVPEARLRLRGDLAHFPFRDGRDGQFLVTARIAGARLDYAEGWPAIEGIDGELRFEGATMRVTAERGSLFGVKLGRVVAEIPDLEAHPNETLTIRGQAAGPTADFLRFVAESPVAARAGRFTAGLRAEGAGNLDLTLTMPLRHVSDTGVKGEFRFAGNRVQVVDGLPPLEQAAGRVEFTRDSLAIPEARAQLFGAPMQLSTRAEADGGLTFLARGTASMASVAQTYGWPILDRVSGSSPWQADIAVRPAGTRVTVRSDLGGIASSLPEPLNKSAATPWPLQVDVDYPAGTDRQEIHARLADRAGLVLRRRETAQGWQVERGGVGVFEPVREADAGVMVAASVPELDVDAWRRVFHSGGSDAGEDGLAGLPLAGIAMQAGTLRVFGQTLTGFDLRALAERDGWKGSVRSDQAEGDFTWRSPGEGALKARLRRLALGGEADEAAPAPEDQVPPRRLPGLDVVVERFNLRGLDLGRLEVSAKNRGGQWQLDSLALANPDGRLTGSGQWRPGSDPRTRLDFRLDSPDVGRLVQRFGYPDAVRNGKAVLTGQLEWRGAPTRIDYPSLSGRMKLDVGKGQFRKLDPGVGRLLGVLSLQSLPRRITLDFRDVFSEGFAFDRISGSIDVASGVMRTDDLEIRGPAARIAMRGTADIAAETQDLKVNVQPTLAESVALGAAAGLINPVAGVVTYLAQKALNDPIERLFAYEYGVTGTWADPKVEKLRAPIDKLTPALPKAPAPGGGTP